jgi:hypothetical protein
VLDLSDTPAIEPTAEEYAQNSHWTRFAVVAGAAWALVLIFGNAAHLPTARDVDDAVVVAAMSPGSRDKLCDNRLRFPWELPLEDYVILPGCDAPVSSLAELKAYGGPSELYVRLGVSGADARAIAAEFNAAAQTALDWRRFIFVAKAVFWWAAATTLTCLIVAWTLSRRRRIGRWFLQERTTIGTTMIIFGIGVLALWLPGALRYVFQESADLGLIRSAVGAIGAMLIGGGWFLRQPTRE